MLALRSCRLFLSLCGWTGSGFRLFFFLRGRARFSFPWLGCSLGAGLGFSYPGPLRFPLLDPLTFSLASRLPCNASLLPSLCPTRLRSLQSPLCLPLLSTFALHSRFCTLLPRRSLLLPLLASNASRRAACFLERLTGPDASLTGYALGGSSSLARGRCVALLTDPLPWFFGLTTLRLWRSCQALSCVSCTAARPPRCSWLTSQAFLSAFTGPGTRLSRCTSSGARLLNHRAPWQTTFDVPCSDRLLRQF